MNIQEMFQNDIVGWKPAFVMFNGFVILCAVVVLYVLLPLVRSLLSRFIDYESDFKRIAESIEDMAESEKREADALEGDTDGRK